MASPSLFLKDFTVLDFAFLDPRSGVEGESFFVSAELFGELDSRDFLFDFGPAKRALKSLVDEAFDHKLLVPLGSGAARATPEGLEILPGEGPAWSYRAPRSSYELFPDAEVSAPVLEYHLARLAASRVPRNIQEIRFSLRGLDRSRQEASFRYTHGLRFHEGNCQRLFHGHRNPIEVSVNGRRAPNWEARLAQEWDGAHFACRSALRNPDALDLPLGTRQPLHSGWADLAYEASQGTFQARFPASRLVLVAAEPSIETLSSLALERLRAWGAQGELRVVAYEGLNKGAICSAAFI